MQRVPRGEVEPWKEAMLDTCVCLCGVGAMGWETRGDRLIIHIAHRGSELDKYIDKFLAERGAPFSCLLVSASARNGGTNLDS